MSFPRRKWLQPKIVADENIELKIIQNLRENHFEPISIFETSRGITDLEVIEIAEKNEALILTEDKDFGEWVFSHHKPTTGVILLRFTI